jgi:hypothetical protein
MQNQTIAILFLSLLLVCPIGCATQESVQSLGTRVAALEERQKEKAAVDQDRQSKLENCIKVDAEEEYWGYIRLNGKEVVGKPGQYSAPVFQWSQAERKKKDKIEECKLLYGPR